LLELQVFLVNPQCVQVELRRELLCQNSF